MVLAHGVLSLSTFAVILCIVVLNARVRHGGVRILSAVYTLSMVAGLLVAVFNDTGSENSGASTFCREEVSVMLKVNAPWAVLQICLLQFLLV